MLDTSNFSQVSMAETALGQLNEPGKAAKLVGRLTGILRGADEGTMCPFLPVRPFPW